MINTKYRIALAGVFAAGLSLTSMAAPANADDFAILDIGEGSLLTQVEGVEKGEAVDVPVTFVCPAGDTPARLSLELSEDVGGGNTATGRSKGMPIGPCSGASQTITITVGLRGSDIPFKVGKATAIATISTHSPIVDRTQEIKIKNK